MCVVCVAGKRDNYDPPIPVLLQGPQLRPTYVESLIQTVCFVFSI